MNRAKGELDKIEEAATTWAVRRHAGLNDIEAEEFQQWLEEDPRHFGAFSEADLALSVLAPPLNARQRRELGRQLAAASPRRPPVFRRWLAYAGAGLAAAAAFVFAARSFDFDSPHDRERMVARPLQHTLADGSVVQLNENAEFEPAFTPATRGVKLLKGEAHFQVAKDPGKPFIVEAGGVKVRAVGTAFSVRFDPKSVEVLVTEGHVKVSETPMAMADHPAPEVIPPPARETDLLAGQRTVIALADEATAPTVTAVSTSEIQKELAWREMRFELSGASLEEAVELFNRKGGVQLEIGDSALRSMHISGIYWANNPDQFAELVGTTLGLKASHVSADRIVFTRL